MIQKCLYVINVNKDYNVTNVIDEVKVKWYQQIVCVGGLSKGRIGSKGDTYEVILVVVVVVVVGIVVVVVVVIGDAYLLFIADYLVHTFFPFTTNPK